MYYVLCIVIVPILRLLFHLSHVNVMLWIIKYICTPRMQHLRGFPETWVAFIRVMSFFSVVTRRYISNPFTRQCLGTGYEEIFMKCYRIRISECGKKYHVWAKQSPVVLGGCYRDLPIFYFGSRRQTDRKTDRLKDRRTGWQKGKHAAWQKDRQSRRQADIQVGRKATN